MATKGRDRCCRQLECEIGGSCVQLIISTVIYECSQGIGCIESNIFLDTSVRVGFADAATVWHGSAWRSRPYRFRR